MEQKYTLKEGHYPDFEISIIDSQTKAAMNLTNYDGVSFVMIDEAGKVVVNDTGTIVDSINGKVSYTFKAGETDTKGIYKAYFSLTKAGVKKISAPTSYFIIEITEDFID